MLSLLLAVPSCTYSFWHGVIPTSYFIFNDFYTCYNIARDIINHRTPQIIGHHQSIAPRYKSYLRVYISGSCRRRAHLRLQGTPIYCIRAPIAARDRPAILLTSSSRCFFPGSTKRKSIATVRICVWQQIQVSKRLVPASSFTYYIFHGFATRLSGCSIIFLKDFLLVQLSLRLHGLATRLCSQRKSAVRS